MNDWPMNQWIIGALLALIGFFLTRLVIKLDKISDKIPELTAEWEVLKTEFLKVLDMHNKVSNLDHRFVLLESMTQAYFKQLDEVKNKIHEL